MSTDTEQGKWELREVFFSNEDGTPLGHRAIPKGWRLVPEEPTEAMRKAGGHVNSEWLNDNAPIGEVRYVMPMQGVWKAMLEVAPIYTPVEEQQP